MPSKSFYGSGTVIAPFPLFVYAPALCQFGYFMTWNSTFRITDTVVEENGNRCIVQRYTPLRVIVGLVPCNYPVVLAVMKIVPSVMAGCPIIIKPSPFTPYWDLKLVELAQQFFLPGVLQILSGDDNLSHG